MDIKAGAVLPVRRQDLFWEQADIPGEGLTERIPGVDPSCLQQQWEQSPLRARVGAGRHVLK